MISKSGLAIVIFAVSGLFTSAESGPIPGDINGDGIVNFADFLILAQNFGKTGDPFTPGDPPATVYDTVVVFVQQLAPPSDEMEIPGLASIQMFALRQNWDAEPELDGIGLSIWPYDRFVTLTRYNLKIPLTVEVSLYVDNNRDGKPDADIPPVYRGIFQGIAGDIFGQSVIQIPKEKIAVDPSKHDRLGICEVILTTPRQGVFKARNLYVRLY